jgi:hypothetical protein
MVFRSGGVGRVVRYEAVRYTEMSSKIPKEGTEENRKAVLRAQIEVDPKSVDVQKRNRRCGIRRMVGVMGINLNDGQNESDGDGDPANKVKMEDQRAIEVR